jgi:large subunit ribosomal protein L30
MADATNQGGTLRITQVRSLSGRPDKHRRTMEALGFRRHQQTIVQKDNPAIRGMLFQVRHLVEFEEVAEGRAASGEGKA